MVKAGDRVFVQVASSNQEVYYCEGVVREYVPASAIIHKEESFVFLGYQMPETEELRVSNGEIWIEGYDAHPFMAEKVFFDMPQGEGHILTPIERWVRVDHRVIEEALVKGLVIKKTTHITGCALNLEFTYVWDVVRHSQVQPTMPHQLPPPQYISSQDKSWEEMYRIFAPALAMQRGLPVPNR